MANSVFVLGISFVTNNFQGDIAQLNISRPLREVNTENYKRRTYGESGEVNARYDQPIMIDRKYAEKLEALRVLVPRREYELELDLNPIDPLSGAIVTKLIPVDPDVKKHFADCLKEQ
ncbi:DUF1293 domain-containing protein [Vibrio sp. CAIM 722]|uniref:DUF1293 domain-containing protein n=1 Tax=Vibrio eleionomae TaxID=2653505 RepID=A0A7X4LJR4_9VIBR|nr:DUF1293 family protein [Vibrio eleionomae]MZI93240.1 DUF1293 domain-containing protein [Vibrio eleionomae]